MKYYLKQTNFVAISHYDEESIKNKNSIINKEESEAKAVQNNEQKTTSTTHTIEKEKNNEIKQGQKETNFFQEKQEKVTKEHDISQAVEKIHQEISILAKNKNNFYKEVFAEAENMTKQAMESILPYYFEKYGTQDLIAFIEKTLKNQLQTNQDKILVEAHHEVIDNLAKFKENELIELKSSESYHRLECRVLWKDGKVERLYEEK